jgi:predicted polyphosphate/ATP-dependent NAD kinase
VVGEGQFGGAATTTREGLAQIVIHVVQNGAVRVLGSGGTVHQLGRTVVLNTPRRPTVYQRRSEAAAQAKFAEAW